MSFHRWIYIFVALTANTLPVSGLSNTTAYINVSTVVNTTISQPATATTTTTTTTTMATIKTTTVVTTTLPTTTTKEVYFKCSSDWNRYRNKCYKFFIDKVKFGTAGEKCRSIGGNLISIGDIGVMNFITSTSAFYAKNEFWIGLKELKTTGNYVWSDGSELTVTKWSPRLPRKYPSDKLDCVFIESPVEKDPGYWMIARCDETRGYVCERPMHSVFTSPSSPTGCSIMRRGISLKNVTSWRWGCYWTIETPMSWKHGHNTCSRFNGRLVWFENVAELDFVKSYIFEKSKIYWTGLYRSNKLKVFKWSYYGMVKIPFSAMHMSASAPMTLGNCGFLKFGHNFGRVKMANCSTLLPVICKKSRIGFTPPTPKSSTVSPKVCPYTGWQSLESYKASSRCFKIFLQTETWKMAKKTCQSYGGDLLSIRTSTEYNIILRKIRRYRKYWIGYNNIDNVKKFEWSDGSVTKYERWVSSNRKTDKKRCVTIETSWSYSSKGYSSHICGTRKYFICATDKADERQSTPPPISRPELLLCTGEAPQWYDFHGFCFYVSTLKYSWHRARTYCQDNGGELASLHSTFDTDFVMQLIHESTETKFWIGFNKLYIGRTYKWSDESPTNYINWHKGEPVNSYSQEKCAGISKESGQWKDYNCGMTAGFICKKVKGAQKLTSVATPPPIRGHCPQEWIEFGDMCYKIFPRKASWSSALSNCRILGPGHDLASIKSKEHERVLIRYIGYYKEKVWIGLNDRLQERNFYWSDNSQVSYTNWAVGEPGRSGDCVQLEVKNLFDGFWREISCYTSLYYMCQRYKDPTIKNPAARKKCKSHKMFDKYRESCYRFIEGNLNWYEADTHCMRLGGNLVSIQDIPEILFVNDLIQNATKPVWIGLSNYKLRSTYKWSIHWPVTFTYWAENEPKDSNIPKCVTMLKSGRWKTTDCNDRRPFVCEINKEKLPTLPPPIMGTCPDDSWFDVGSTKCYRLTKIKRTWADSNFVCNLNHGILASFHSLPELMHVSKIIRLMKHNSKFIVWIGLYKQKNGGRTWIDRSPVDFLHWQPPIDNNDHISNACTYMNITTSKWKNRYCSHRILALCMTDRNITVVKANKITKPNETSTKSGLTTGQILGVIALCVAIVLIAIAILVFVRRRRLLPGSSPITDSSRSFSFDNEMYNQTVS